MKPETRFKLTFREKLNMISGSWFVKVQQVSLRGIPDLLGCINGKMVALELKVDADLESLQIYNLEQIRRAGGYAATVTPSNQHQILEELRKL